MDDPGGGHDEFEFQAFSTAGMERFVRPPSLRLATACTDFDATMPPSPDKPRIQFVLERTAG